MKKLFTLVTLAALLLPVTDSIAESAADLHVYTHISVAAAATFVSYGLWRLIIKQGDEPNDKNAALIMGALTVGMLCIVKEMSDVSQKNGSFSGRDLAAGSIGIGAASLTIWTFKF